MRFRNAVLAVVVLLGVLNIAPLEATEHESFYVTSAELPPQLLSPPPAEGTVAWQQNVQGVLQAQEHITQADIIAMRQEQHSQLRLLTDEVGPDFTAQKFPKAYALVQHAFDDCEIITVADKDFWHTRRPYLTDHRVKLMVDPIDASPAYPSGHTSGSRVAAEVLGLLFPNRLTALRAKADSISYHRIQAGVHDHGDVEGGRMVAMLVLGALLKSDAFQSDLAAAREEIEK